MLKLANAFSLNMLNTEVETQQPFNSLFVHRKSIIERYREDAKIKREG